MGVVTVHEKAQYTTLWGASTQSVVGKEVGAKSLSLEAVGEKVIYPAICGSEKASKALL